MNYKYLMLWDSEDSPIFKILTRRKKKQINARELKTAVTGIWGRGETSLSVLIVSADGHTWVSYCNKVVSPVVSPHSKKKWKGKLKKTFLFQSSSVTGLTNFSFICKLMNITNYQLWRRQGVSL